ncbi:MAG: NotI family restriction endonuclease [Anaerolineae bacterium]
MAENAGNRPAEIFGYPIWNQSKEVQNVRERHWCPFLDRRCDKKSRLIDFPFGVCSAEHSGGVHTICPHRFEEQGSIEGISRVLEDIALHYFGDFNNTIVFSEVRLPNVGSIDYVLVRHKPMKPEVEDFVSVEFQSDSTTSTGGLVQGILDFFEGQDLQGQSYKFGMNTYDSIKRAITQLMNKGIVYETWDTKCYWVIQEYIYANLVSRYGFKTDGFSPGHASRFALYSLVPKGDRLALNPGRFISTTVEEVYQAMRNNPGIPGKDKFVQHLNTKLRLRLSVRAS